MLEKKYDHKLVESDKYEKWLEGDFFKSGDMSKEPYCIVIPPPNVTGKLHLGHAWDTSIQDILIRYKRMDGYDALWVPGMDHAGIATQAKVDKKLREMGINPRGISREEWLEHAWAWKDEYADNIHKQWAKMGLSLDYSKERFTLDDGLSRAVRDVFVRLYNEGLIYRGERIINWDPVQMTALSNEEVIYKDIEGAFYHIKYMLEGSDSEYLEVATTRPETLFGDTGVAVNPNDSRYSKFIGKRVVLPILGKLIPIVGDEHADPEFGTGVVKITPAHDPNDFEVGNRHNLERVIVINPDGSMNEHCGKYEGMDRFVCREELIRDLEKDGLLLEVENITHSAPFSERSDALVEPYLSKQWFVKMRELADRVLENQKNVDTKVNFVPERYEKIMNHWMEITYDWCISRQLWWGHRIPAWYRGDEVYVGIDAPLGEGWVQDSDVLDTWFSSALWPFSTLGFPDDTEMFKRYYPNDVLVTGYDIIPFWVNRMTFQGLHFTGKRPFRDCLIHGLIRDKIGRKMSKSLGNGVDPMDVIDKYGCDSLRFFLTTNSASGMDLRYDEEKVASTWNFVNKLWNASRFVLMNIGDLTRNSYTFSNLSDSDKWILGKLNRVILNVRKHLDSYDFNVVGSTLYAFIWDDFCDWYIEFSKGNMNDTTKSVLYRVLMDIIKMLHPFMPYVTEEIYGAMPFRDKESIMIDSYPVYDRDMDFASDFDRVTEFISKVRNVKQERGIPKDSLVFFKGEHRDIILRMLKVSDDALVSESAKDGDGILIGLYDFSIKYLFDTSKSKEEEIESAKALIEKLKGSIERRKKLLSNENYVNKAPSAVVEKERMDLAKEEEEIKRLMERI
mgnify:FL=1